MTKYRICKYDGEFGYGYSAQYKNIFTLGRWCNVRNIYGDIIVRYSEEDMRSLIDEWKRQSRADVITPIEEIADDK